MTLRDIITASLQRLGMQRQQLAQALNTSGAAVTRLLSRRDQDQTLGQMQQVANAIGIQWFATLHDARAEMEAIHTLAQRADDSADPIREPELGLPRTLQAAAESQLTVAMTQHTEPQPYTLDLERDGPVEIVGWHLGQTPIDPDRRDDLWDVYWVVYTSKYAVLAGQPTNVILHDRDGHISPHTFDHAYQRAPLLRPSSLGRVYRDLRPDTLVQRLTHNASLLVEVAPGGTRTTSLVLHDVRVTSDPYPQVRDALAAAARLVDEGPAVSGSLGSRVALVHRAHGIAASWRAQDLRDIGLDLSPSGSAVDIEHALADATPDALARFAVRYRLRPEWVRSGTGRSANESTLPSAGWYTDEIQRALLSAQQAGTLQCVYLMADDAGGADGIRLAWQTAHPVVPGASLYDAVTPLSWSFAPQRVLLKGVCQFALAHRMPLMGLSLPGADDRAGLLLPEVIRHPGAAPLDVTALLAEHGGVSETGQLGQE